MHFLCDPIDLRKSVEGTLKVLEKSLKTVWDEVHFIVNLYSFPLPSVPQAKPPFPELGHLLPSQAEKLSNLPCPLDTLTITLVCIFSSNLSHS